MNEENKDVLGSAETEKNDELYENLADRAKERRAARKEKKRKKTIKTAIISVLCIFLAACIALGTFAFLEIGGKLNKTAAVNIDKGSSAYVIAEELESAGVINSALMFKAYCKARGLGSDFKFGRYEFNKGASYAEIAEALTQQGNASIVRVTIPEGTGIYDYVKNVNGNKVTVLGMGSILEKAGVCTKADFYEAVEKVQMNGYLLSEADSERAYVALEGYLFPDTYQFYAYDSKECAVLAVEKMIENMRKKFTSQMVERANEINMSVNEVLTLASILQMEAGNAGEYMPKVAAVFYNRMNRGEKLGSSPTCYYGNAFDSDDGRYDTYKIKGLPPGPLCSPGMVAINAVLYPEKDFSGYFYFITDSSGKFYFHKTYNAQVNTINRLKRENKWIYEYLD
ncbi:MAG: endolytic transglycosylase MltG [Clostridia bacterium]|nr:endolytic transglycosylase MltG [Clostridia bacterium]